MLLRVAYEPVPYPANWACAKRDPRVFGLFVKGAVYEAAPYGLNMLSIELVCPDQIRRVFVVDNIHFKEVTE